MRRFSRALQYCCCLVHLVAIWPPRGFLLFATMTHMMKRAATATASTVHRAARRRLQQQQQQQCALSTATASSSSSTTVQPEYIENPEFVPRRCEHGREQQQQDHDALYREDEDDVEVDEGGGAIRRSAAARAGSSRIGMVTVPLELQLAVNRLIEGELVRSSFGLAWPMPRCACRSPRTKADMREHALLQAPTSRVYDSAPWRSTSTFGLRRPRRS